jgi:predicted nucleic acid-binding protein
MSVLGEPGQQPAAPGQRAWIAACCLVNGLPLATFNTKDFADFVQHGLELVDVS